VPAATFNTKPESAFFNCQKKIRWKRINVLKLWVRYKNDGLRALDFFNTLQNIAHGL
jgi:hypothetical protein